MKIVSNKQQQPKEFTSTSNMTGRRRIHRRSLTHVGSMCLRTENESNPPIAIAGMIMEHSVSDRDMKERITERLLNNPHFFRLRSRIDEKLSHFEQVDVNLDDHVSRRILLSDGEEKESELLNTMIGEYMSKPFSIMKPMWEIILVDGYSKGFLVLFRCHHVIGDGTSIALICQKLCDGDTVERNLDNIRRSTELKRNQEMRTTWGKVKHSTVFKWLSVVAIMLFLLIGCIRLIFKWIWMTVILGLDPPTRVSNSKISTGGEKRVAFSSNDMTVDDAKAIGKPFGATVNDVMLNCLAASIDRYTKHKGDEVKRMDIRVGIPVNIRRTLEDFQVPSNKFGFMVCKIPLGISEREDRLRWIQAETTQNKRLPESLFTNFLNFVMSLVLPIVLLKLIARYISRYQSAIASNVAAVSEQCTLKGSKITGILPFTPLPYGIGLGLMILSYNGHINIAVTTDKKLIPDPELIIQYFLEEFNSLKNAKSTSA
jgi:diacylglycerol O-acyltransferase